MSYALRSARSSCLVWTLLLWQMIVGYYFCYCLSIVQPLPSLCVRRTSLGWESLTYKMSVTSSRLTLTYSYYLPPQWQLWSHGLTFLANILELRVNPIQKLVFFDLHQHHWTVFCHQLNNPLFEIILYDPLPLRHEDNGEVKKTMDIQDQMVVHEYFSSPKPKAPVCLVFFGLSEQHWVTILTSER